MTTWHARVALTAAIGAVAAGPGVTAAVASAPAPPYVVVVREGADAAVVAARHGVETGHVYTETLDGFAADLTATQSRALERDRDVEVLVADHEFHVPPDEAEAVPAASRFVAEEQTVSTGVRRVGGLESPTAAIDGFDERVDADVAIIDAGVDPDHPDLHVVETIGCAAPAFPARPMGDHGTHVAGIAAALDDDAGVVGVAPGARIWSIRVADLQGDIRLSSLVCAVEWVADNADTIDVANLSLEARRDAPVTADCGVVDGQPPDPLHRAICLGVQRGVTFVAAAGNRSIDARYVVPGGYPEVITVSAYADFDGEPGGTAAPDCPEAPLPEVDDTLAFFSNHGSAVDVAAPGVCIRSTVAGGGYGVMHGTSMAAPHVAGAVALLRATTPQSTPAQVRDDLLAAGEPGPLPEDPDAYPEPLLDVSGF
ncbi:S8 family serine peptidase [Egicoccus sp. AB-alg2]|uniref:S8 family serine peptidase n=1 Tax=Egicoccus sp. AB-alg2 TaxID=3242693 RepID=UPI00359DD3FA